MTHLYLAYNPFADPALAAWDWESRPLNVLIALPYLTPWERLCRRAPGAATNGRRMLDSGAYSAWRSGKEIDIEALARESMLPRWTEAVGLDVIGSAEGSVANLDRMLALGSPAMPVFHVGDPWDHLDHYVAHWPKVGLSCRFGEPLAESIRFYERCFARHWPRRYHSFGWTARDVLLRFPFHSADSSTWSLGAAYRTLNVNGRRVQMKGMSSPKCRRYLEVHAAEVLDFQSELASRWRGALETIP